MPEHYYNRLKCWDETERRKKNVEGTVWYGYFAIQFQSVVHYKFIVPYATQTNFGLNEKYCNETAFHFPFLLWPTLLARW